MATADALNEARRKRDLTVAATLGIDPAVSSDLAVDLESRIVSWAHLDNTDGAMWHRFREKLLVTNPDQWEKVLAAESEWRANFPTAWW